MKNGAENFNQRKGGFFQKDGNSKTCPRGQEEYVKCRISVDEVWPVFFLDEGTISPHNEVEVSEQFYTEYRAFMDNYDALQKKLKGMYDNQRIDREKRIRKDIESQSAAKSEVA